MRFVTATFWIILILAGCARTYHIYNFVDNGSKLTQRIEVLAEVPKSTNINADVTADVGVLP